MPRAHQPLRLARLRRGRLRDAGAHDQPVPARPGDRRVAARPTTSTTRLHSRRRCATTPTIPTASAGTPTPHFPRRSRPTPSRRIVVDLTDQTIRLASGPPLHGPVRAGPLALRARPRATRQKSSPGIRVTFSPAPSVPVVRRSRRATKATNRTYREEPPMSRTRHLTVVDGLAPGQLAAQAYAYVNRDPACSPPARHGPRPGQRPRRSRTRPRPHPARRSSVGCFASTTSARSPPSTSPTRSPASSNSPSRISP